MFNSEIFSERLRKARKSKNISQSYLAKQIGVTAATISSYESDNVKIPSLDKAFDLAEALNVSIDWLCGKDDNNTNDVTNFSVQDYLYSIVRVITEMSTITEENMFGDKKVLDITFTRSPLIAFISKAKDLLKVYHDGTLDEEFYVACIDKLVKDYSRYEYIFDNFLTYKEATAAFDYYQSINPEEFTPSVNQVYLHLNGEYVGEASLFISKKRYPNSQRD